MRHTFGSRARISLLNSLNDVYGEFDTIIFAIRIVPERLPDGSNVMDQEMCEVPSFSIRAGDNEMIAKLVGAGYLRPDQRHDPNAITKAIERMKRDLRNGNGSVR
jgi:hypothetical protein